MIQAQIFSALSQSSDVVGIVGTRIYPVRLPREAVLPAVVYQIISVDPITSINGDSGIDYSSVQISAWAKDYAKAHELAFAVRKALVESGLRIVTSGQNDFEDIDTRSYCVNIDLNIWSTSNVGVPPGPLENNNEMRVYGGYIQWRAMEGSAWVNVIALSELKGDDGAQGPQGEQGPAGDPFVGTAIYFPPGNETTDGSWRQRVDNGALVVEQRVAGIWTVKGRYR